jgi:hypothetical protein
MATVSLATAIELAQEAEAGADAISRAWTGCSATAQATGLKEARAVAELLQQFCELLLALEN